MVSVLPAVLAAVAVAVVAPALVVAVVHPVDLMTETALALVNRAVVAIKTIAAVTVSPVTVDAMTVRTAVAAMRPAKVGLTTVLLAAEQGALMRLPVAPSLQPVSPPLASPWA